MKWRFFLIFCFLLSPPLFAQSEKGHVILKFGVLDYTQTRYIKNSYYQRNSDIYFGLKEYDYTNNHYFYEIKSGYSQNCTIEIVNSSKKQAAVKVRLKCDKNLLLGVTGKGGDEPLIIPPGKLATIKFKAFTQDSFDGIYPIELELLDEDSNIIDMAYGQIHVINPQPNVSITSKGNSGLFYSYELENHGGDIANFSLNASNLPGIRIIPSVDHYFLPAKGKISFELHQAEGISADLSGYLVMKANGVSHQVPVKLARPEGNLQYITLDPIVRLRRVDWYCTNRPLINLNYNIPYIEKKVIKDLDLSKDLNELQTKGTGFDTDASGKLDHFELTINKDILMLGDDYDEDGIIDFFRKSDSPGAGINRSYLKINGEWNETNIVDAQLINTFLPFNNATEIQPHAVDIILNGKTIRSYNNTVLTGTIATRVRLDYLTDPAIGLSNNMVTISTKHLPEAHYQVNSQNTLVIHYTKITIPIISKEEITGLTPKLDSEIAELERIVNSVKLSETDRAAAEKNITELKFKRDTALKRMNDYLDKNKNQLPPFSGIQYKGNDLALFTSDLQMTGKKISGIARNSGYSGCGYRLSLHIYKNDKYLLLQSQDFPYLPPFCRRRFEFNLENFDPKARSIYKISIAAIKPQEDELTPGDNEAYFTSGPTPDPVALHQETLILSKSLNLENDQATLSQEPDIAIIDEISALNNTNVRSRIKFSAPVSNIDESRRLFLLEE